MSTKALNPCFENIKLENIVNCSNDETVAGLSTKLFYIPTEHIATFTKPPKAANTAYEARVTIPNNGLVPVNAKGWKEIDVLVDKNKLTNMLVGTKGNMKVKVDLDVFIRGFRKQTVGFQQVHANTPMIYGIADSTGQMWIIGNKENPAFFTSLENTSGDTAESDSGITGKISANTSILAYDGEMTILADS